MEITNIHMDNLINKNLSDFSKLLKSELDKSTMDDLFNLKNHCQKIILSNSNLSKILYSLEHFSNLIDTPREKELFESHSIDRLLLLQIQRLLMKCYEIKNIDINRNSFMLENKKPILNDATKLTLDEDDNV